MHAQHLQASPRVRRRFGPRLTAWAATAVVLVGLTACMPEPNPVETDASVTDPPATTSETEPATTQAPEPEPQPEPQPLIFLTEVFDGDTINTTAGKVRLIGIDAPERGECGYQQATEAITDALRTGDSIMLELPSGQNDTDAYGRLLRYVSTDEVEDLGLLLIESGLAIARYDSRDGYPAHPREDEYHEKQIATRSADGAVITPECDKRAAERAAAEEATSSNTGTDGTNTDKTNTDTLVEPWYMQYRSCSQLKKNTVGDPRGPFNVNIPAEKDMYDWFQYGTGFRGDGDGDGLACE